MLVRGGQQAQAASASAVREGVWSSLSRAARLTPRMGDSLFVQMGRYEEAEEMLLHALSMDRRLGDPSAEAPRPLALAPTHRTRLTTHRTRPTQR
jgi:hypothetical protein